MTIFKVAEASTPQKARFASRLEQEKQSATQVLHDAQDEFRTRASEYGSQAKDALFSQADDTKRNISSNLSALGGALRAASEHLANSDQKTASKFVLDAAGGLESLSGSLKNKPFEEVLQDVRAFGKDHSGALMAGSVLAGLALGRFLKSSAPASAASNTSKSEPAGSFEGSSNVWDEQDASVQSDGTEPGFETSDAESFR